jgi:hypothetical protein
MSTAIKEDSMTESANIAPAVEVGPEAISRAINDHCERALRRLRVLARERNDVLLSQALRSVRSAAALSAAPLPPAGRGWN